MLHLDSLYPDENRRVAEQLFVLEVGLRELIIELLSASTNSQWYKDLLPPDVTQKYLRGIQAERAATWTSHVEHHPLYYIDFPDLGKIVDRNWKASFQDMFGDKAVFGANLRSLEPIRNKLAHNRKISPDDCKVVDGVVTAFECAVGTDRLTLLVHRCSVAVCIQERIVGLMVEITHARDAMLSLSLDSVHPVWSAAKSSWWFNTTFLTAANYMSRLEIAESKVSEMRRALAESEREVESLRQHVQRTAIEPTSNDVVGHVSKFFALWADFQKQPRTRGSGHKLESWLHANDVGGLANAALESLELLKNRSAK